jgi:peptide/nickel transport system substrate-binding protein/oligopeptide transport system substrate-binding protein
MKSNPSRVAALFAVLLIFAPACRPSPRPGYFHTYMQSDPGRIDPFYSSDVISGRVLAATFAGLFTIDSQGRPAPDLVDSYRFNGVVLECALKKGVLFHSGRPLSADDVIFSFERVWKGENPTSPRKWVFEKVLRIEKTGERSLRVTLSGPQSTFLHRLTMPCAFVISREDYLNGGRVIGCGPFSVAQWRQDEQIVLERFPGYYGPRPALEGMVFKIIPEDLTARFEFMNGALDYFEIPYMSDIDFTGRASRVVTVPELGVHYVALNTQRPPFDSREFRRALNLAVDRRAVMKALFKNRFEEARGVVPSGTADYASAGRPFRFDPGEAARIVRRLGLEGARIVLLIKADSQVSLIAQMLQHYLGRAGLRVEVTPLEWSALKSRTFRGDFEMAYFTWVADYPEPENFLYPLFYSKNAGAGGNRSFYRNAAVDRMLDAARGTLERQKRFDIYRRVERIIIDDSPWIFLWYSDKRIALGRRVGEYVPCPVFSGMKGDRITLVKSP